MNHQNHEDYHTCLELLEKYPNIDLIGWDARTLGIFYSCNLLIGKKSGRESKTLILEPSFLELREYAYDQFERRFPYKKNK